MWLEWGARDPHGGNNPTSFIHRNEVSPTVPRAVTRFPEWIHTRPRALLPPWSVLGHRRRPASGMECSRGLGEGRRSEDGENLPWCG